MSSSFIQSRTEKRNGSSALIQHSRLRARVRPHVRRQVAGLREGLAARLAGMRLLARMRSHVHSHLAGLREGLATR